MSSPEVIITRTPDRTPCKPTGYFGPLRCTVWFRRESIPYCVQRFFMSLPAGTTVTLNRTNGRQWQHSMVHICTTTLSLSDWPKFLNAAPPPVAPWMEESCVAYKKKSADSPGQGAWPHRPSDLARAGLEGLSLADLRDAEGSADTSSPT